MTKSANKPIPDSPPGGQDSAGTVRQIFCYLILCKRFLRNVKLRKFKNFRRSNDYLNFTRSTVCKTGQLQWDQVVSMI